MALEKAITQADGYDATYWRIVQLNLSWLNQRGRIVVAGYKDRERRLARPNDGIKETIPLIINSELFQQFFEADSVGDSTKDTLEQTGTDRETAYQIIKQEIDQFSDAIDYLEADANFTAETAGLTVDITDDSTSRDSTIQTWTYDFGDGTTETVDRTKTGYATGDENVSHTYDAAGDYTITLTVDDGEYFNTTKAEVSVS